MGNQGNGIGSVLIKTIFILLGVYVIAINVTLWATSHNVGGEQLHGVLDNWNFYGFHSSRMSDFGYVGFESFYNLLGTFPGLRYTQGITSTYLDIVSGYDVTGIGILDALIGVVRILTAPMLLGITIVTDIINNVIWFLGFLNIVPNTPQGTFLTH